MSKFSTPEEDGFPAQSLILQKYSLQDKDLAGSNLLSIKSTRITY